VIKEVASEMTDMERHTLARVEFMMSRVNFADQATFGKESFAPMIKDKKAKKEQEEKEEKEKAAKAAAAAAVQEGLSLSLSSVDGSDATSAATETDEMLKTMAVSAEDNGRDAASTATAATAAVVETELDPVAAVQQAAVTADLYLEKHPLFKEYTPGSADPFEALIEAEEVRRRMDRVMKKVRLWGR
jgi:hypothetical protein